jgi:hypothetical protein
MSQTLALIGLFLTIIMHVVATVWWASAITTTLKFQSDDLKRIAAALTTHDNKFYEKEEAKIQVDKRDREMADVWNEIAKVRDKVSLLEGDRRAHQNK